MKATIELDKRLFFQLTVVSMLMLLGMGCLWHEDESLCYSDMNVLAPMKKISSTIHYVNPNRLPQDLTKTDYREMEKIVGGIKGISDPVVVTGVFSELDGIAVLYRTQDGDIYLVRDKHRRWILSRITFPPLAE